MQTKKEIIQTFRKVLKGKVEFALLFGSIAKNKLTAESDIDVGIFMRQYPSSEKERLEFKFSLAREFERDVDVIFLNDCDPIIAMQVLSNGEMILNNNPKLAFSYKAQKISQYIDFKRSRKVIEDNLIRNRLYD